MATDFGDKLVILLFIVLFNFFLRNDLGKLYFLYICHNFILNIFLLPCCWKGILEGPFTRETISYKVWEYRIHLMFDVSQLGNALIKFLIYLWNIYSALYVVDLVKFRQTAAGDTLRVFYETLSKDPNSLSNLDQVIFLGPHHYFCCCKRGLFNLLWSSSRR